MIELDVFDAPYETLYLAEVEFSSVNEANSFVAPDWFGEDVTYSGVSASQQLSESAKVILTIMHLTAVC